ncbi:hypothetical protein TanjilG_21986 [Lupinus angustifolius]|uniref:Ubiquinol oxidase n=1 Tax=Lupinus angustifolius TaxID=3871 RepID=A0A394DCB0_LUPAN|nr:hypothetical protein TanjilG_21986 [Lupinus angustifolius]
MHHVGFVDAEDMNLTSGKRKFSSLIGIQTESWHSFGPPPPTVTSNAIVEFTAPVFNEEEEDLEIKIRSIIDNVPVRVSNTSGNSEGSGSGDFHQNILNAIESGKVENVPAPAIAIDYWRLPKDANLKDVNHFAWDIHHQGKELKEAPAPVGYH